ncbi:hypothetical protein BDV36DRAFT_275760 [Aspergillus pseudocaelatus]|uniref:Uncharacterized protein n=1 Tax=Aspergillus pseudocaelatus TaxID=1825620 RepID=A0ABQ6W1T7_9EURO|nr:hypothetical protein BDV36DRAFT_275760 [Aspergillus pseudocaelatus]
MVAYHPDPQKHKFGLIPTAHREATQLVVADADSLASGHDEPNPNLMDNNLVP